jgi:translation initiation factor 4G
MERGGSRRGMGRDGAPGPDGWTQTAQPPRPQKAGDLTTLGKIRSSSGSPSLNLLGRKPVAKEEPAAVAANPFALLQGGDDVAAPEVTSPPGNAPAEPAPERKRLNLAKRTVSTPTMADAEADKKDDEDEEGEIKEGESKAAGELDEATKRSIGNSVAEYLGVKMIDEGKATFTALPEAHRGELAKAFITKAMESKKDVVDAVVNLFEAVAEDGIVSTADFRTAFEPSMETLEDLAVDSARAFDFMGELLAAAGLAESDVEHLQGKMVSEEDDLEGIQKKLMESYQKAQSVRYSIAQVSAQARPPLPKHRLKALPIIFTVKP